MIAGEENLGAVTETVKVVAELAKAVPIYEDALQPAAKQVGKSLETVGRAVNAALMPVEGLIWGIEAIRDFVHEKVTRKLRDVPIENVQAPKPHVAVPLIEALRYTGSEPDLSELYANLLATSMDKQTAHDAHPGFVEIIKNMSPDEAKIVQFLADKDSFPALSIEWKFDSGGSLTVMRNQSLIGRWAGCDRLELVPSYLDNLSRLGLISVLVGQRARSDEPYEEIMRDPNVATIVAAMQRGDGYTIETVKASFGVSDLGRQFISACVREKQALPEKSKDEK